MQIRDPSMSVVHLTMRKGTQPLAIGSGVLYERNGKCYIATAWHNLTGRHSESLRPLSSTGGVPDNAVAVVPLIVNGLGQSSAVRLPFTLPLETDENTSYLVHPVGWPRIDAAVIPIDPDAAFAQELRFATGDVHQQLCSMRTSGGLGATTDLQPIQRCAGAYATCGITPEDLLELGDDLFVLGYPRGISDFFASPIWKRATVASDPHVGWNRWPKFLVDCASREGMSGAPVVSYSRTGLVDANGVTFQGVPRSALLQGIYVGRVVDPASSSEDRMFEAQIGTVWKREVLDEIIDANVPALHSSQVGVGPSIIEEAVRAKWPRDPDYHMKVLQRTEFQSGVAQVILEHLNGNADPSPVVELAVEHAKRLASSTTSV
jgi:hypothetical protein